MNTHATDPDSQHALMQECHQLQRTLKETLRWVAHQHSASLSRSQTFTRTVAFQSVVELLRPFGINEEQLQFLLRQIALTNNGHINEQRLKQVMDAMIQGIQTGPSPSEPAVEIRWLQALDHAQHQLAQLWQVNAQLWEENQRLMDTTDSDTTLTRKLHQLIREKTALIEQIGQQRAFADLVDTDLTALANQNNALKAENLALMQTAHMTSQRAQQLESVLHHQRNQWHTTRSTPPPASGLYWISDGQHVWQSHYNAHQQLFEDSPGGLWPDYWMPLIPPSAPL